MAKNFMSSILDELMGRDRNALPTEQPKKMNWDDPDMCPHYLVCFCPHDLFVNTKADLGSCNKIHDENMRKKYLEEAPSHRRSLYEAEFIRSAEKMIADIEAKIKRGKMRIALANGPDGGTYAGPGSKNAEKIALLTERINALLEEAEAAGCEGDVEKAQGLMKLCDQLKDEREQLKSNEISHPWNPDKAMQVCEVCGSYLIIGEAQHRLDDHIMGKQHVGFAMLRKNLEDVKKQKETREREEREKIEKERERRWAGTDRGKRDRERSVERVKRDRDRGTRDRSDRDRHREPRGEKSKEPEDKDKKRHRSRSRDREKRKERRERSRERDNKEIDKSRHRDSKDKDRDRSRRHSDDKRRSRRSRSGSKDRDKNRKRSGSRSRDHKDKDKDRKRSRSEKGGRGESEYADPGATIRSDRDKEAQSLRQSKPSVSPSNNSGQLRTPSSPSSQHSQSSQNHHEGKKITGDDSEANPNANSNNKWAPVGENSQPDWD